MWVGHRPTLIDLWPTSGLQQKTYFQRECSVLINWKTITQKNLYSRKRHYVKLISLLQDENWKSVHIISSMIFDWTIRLIRFWLHNKILFYFKDIAFGLRGTVGLVTKISIIILLWWIAYAILGNIEVGGVCSKHKYCAFYSPTI